MLEQHRYVTRFNGQEGSVDDGVSGVPSSGQSETAECTASRNENYKRTFYKQPWLIVGGGAMRLPWIASPRTDKQVAGDLVEHSFLKIAGLKATYSIHEQHPQIVCQLKIKHSTESVNRVLNKHIRTVFDCEWKLK